MFACKEIRCVMLFYIFIHLLHKSHSCILLLNGWTPLTVYERATYAEIVVSANVVRAFKDVRSDSETYTAEVQVLEVYKGAEFVDDVSSVERSRKIYNISNFGDRSMCYADVVPGDTHIMFLTMYNGRLSAKYDDIFGAVAEFTSANEQQILDYLGWHTWSKWNGCSAPCDGGVQMRHRTCSRENITDCTGASTETRKCNTYSCNEITDLVTKLGMPKMPFGVYKNPNRTHAYQVTPHAKLFLPVASLYEVSFPRDFSVALTFKLNPGYEGYLLTVNDIRGRQRIGLHFGTNAKFEYLEYHDGRVVSLDFDVAVTDGQWHQLAFSVKDDIVTLFYDCDTVMSKTLIRRKSSTLGKNLMIAIGPYFARNGQPFRGSIEQIVLAEDPSFAELQCHVQSDVTDMPVKDDNKPVTSKPTQTDLNNVTTKPTVYGSDWSSWSYCSASCGQGRQSRTLFCRNNIVAVDRCVAKDSPHTQTRLCYLQECQVKCQTPCLNGGECNANGTCDCPMGYDGKRCETPSCPLGCENNGICVGPNMCACPAGYTGANCEMPKCEQGCSNGGRCVAPGKCACPYGYLQPTCKPYCPMQCHNGGKCVRHNVCRCKKGYTGKDCSVATCKRGCFNGGKCVAANRCSCPSGYRGRYCQKAKCRPRCQNSGKCIAPNVCGCRGGYYGNRCQLFQCFKKCKNGGTCTGPNRCACPAGFSGRRCQRARCRSACLNGGRCRKNNKCKCPPGFKGRRCETRICKYEKHSVPHTRSYRRVVREEYVAKCGPWHWKTCVKTRLKYALVVKDTYRTAYRCVRP
ncbi:protein kinase C-binding protein NELL1-like isoform X1 [Haliotis rufescens]|uniref:protein kinase C-binding protein NELL1-like isoform X1 n=1 Tax=Haliotis rufescens TaxID=6454 RepID=UPI001EAFDD9B|nr:protein kinase C-binding protein NELL1-like isoform X1 [Haliotis rufescens]